METIIDRLRVELETDEGCKHHIYLDHLGLAFWINLENSNHIGQRLKMKA